MVGVGEVTVGYSSLTLSFYLVKLPGEFLTWRALILFLSGMIYLTGSLRLPEVHARARVVLAGLMVWIVAGLDLFSLLLDSIAGGGGEWFNSPAGFLATYLPPYNPVLYIFPLSLLVLILFFRTPMEGDGEGEIE